MGIRSAGGSTAGIRLIWLDHNTLLAKRQWSTTEVTFQPDGDRRGDARQFALLVMKNEGCWRVLASTDDLDEVINGGESDGSDGMRRISRYGVAAAAVAMAAGLATAVSPAAASAAGSVTARDVYFVHGYSAGDCATRWNPDVLAFRNWGWTGRMHTVGYYQGDRNCSDHISRTATKATSITTLGQNLAWYLYRNHTVKGERVNLVGHSMGGLISRAAIAGVAARQKGFPPKLNVPNVVTLGTPHQGVDTANWGDCGSGDTQCRQMHSKYPEYSFTTKLPHAPQGNGGTDWTLIGASDDTVVSWKSGVDLRQRAQHKIHYLPGQKLTHSALRVAVSGSGKYQLTYWNTGMPDAKKSTNGSSPVYATYQALRHDKDW